jgi:hypothetical protein
MMRPALIGLLALFLSGCGGPAVDLSQGLQVVDLASGWFDLGVVDGKNKLVPSISFKLKNVSEQTLSVLQVNAVFRRVGDPVEWGDGFRPVVGSEGLAPGATSNPVSVDSQRGYTGSEARAEMLKNSQFVDAEVDLFAKYGSTQWKAIGKFPITRQLLTR